MPQWDVYANPSERSRETVPFLIDLQSDLLSALSTRYVAPLMRSRLAAENLPRRLCPQLAVDGVLLVLVAHEAGPIAARLLKEPRGSLRLHSAAIIDALDAVISGI